MIARPSSNTSASACTVFFLPNRFIEFLLARLTSFRSRRRDYTPRYRLDLSAAPPDVGRTRPPGLFGLVAAAGRAGLKPPRYEQRPMNGTSGSTIRGSIVTSPAASRAPRSQAEWGSGGPRPIDAPVPSAHRWPMHPNSNAN